MADFKTPADLKYAESDEWFRIEGDTVTIGISDYAQNALNDIVYVELPEIGDSVDAGESFGSVESVKAASDLYTAIGGEVVAINSDLEDDPEVINSDPFGEGWIVKLKVSGEPDVSKLMDATAYAEHCENR